MIDHLTNLVYHCVSGCMTAQVAFEVDYQNGLGSVAHNPAAMAQPVTAQPYYDNKAPNQRTGY